MDRGNCCGARPRAKLRLPQSNVSGNLVLMHSSQGRTRTLYVRASRWPACLVMLMLSACTSLPEPAPVPAGGIAQLEAAVARNRNDLSARV